MKKLPLHVAAISVLLAGSASAADIRMPVKAPPPAAVAVYNWTGCYVGAGGGYGMFDQKTGFRDDGVPVGVSNDVGGRGWFGTVQVGCDYQIASNVVIGAFGDYDFSGIKGDWSNPAFSGFFGTSIGEEKLKSSWAAGGRIGWVPWSTQQFLVYVSGGYTQARFSQTTLLGAFSGVPTGVVIPKHTYAGWFIGTGYEYGLGFLPGLFWKTEYRFADYGSDTIFVQAGAVVTTDSVEQRKYVHTVRSELVWRFNFGGAAAAYAADVRPLPVKAAPAPVAAYNWTGCYLGAGGGYGLFNQETQRLINGVIDGLPNDNGGRGWFGTVQVGCDYQAGANFVIGAFGDYDFSGIKGDMAVTPSGVVGEEKLKNSWAAGGRIGWLPSQQLLVFVSGGYTQARFGQVDFLFGFNGALTDTSILKHTYSGWFLGTGYEYALGWLPGLFWKTEYRYADYGSDVLPVVFRSTGAPTTDSLDMHKRTHTVRSELVWRFNFGGPVVARY